MRRLRRSRAGYRDKRRERTERDQRRRYTKEMNAKFVSNGDH